MEKLPISQDICAGISLLYVKEEKSVQMWGFFSPLSKAVWGLMLLAGLGVSVVMFLIAR